MYTLALYIEEVRVDLFKDESVTITDSIQNIRDIEKVFTAFTKTFSLPASKVNNQIFKHYYNYEIDNGFDARKKVDAVLELNSLPFRTGKIKLEGVDLKENKAHTYRVTFFGDIVELKDKLGEDKLEDLDLSGYDKLYDENSIWLGLVGDVTVNTNVTVPLITHTQRLYFNSGASTVDTGNLHYVNDNKPKGVKWNELKYAMRLNTIIKQIEIDYDLKFSTDFFRNTAIKEMHDLFIWCHRKSGYVEDLSGANQVETLVNFNQIDSNLFFEIYNTTFGSFWTTSQLISLSLIVAPASGYFNVPYGIRLTQNGITVYNSGITLTGQTTLNVNTDWTYTGGYYEVYVETSLDMAFSTVRWTGSAKQGPNVPITQVIYNSGYFTATEVFTFNMAKQMPDMKILDFLTGLFRLFNLTAYVEDGVIIVKTLDEYFSEGTGHGLGNKGIDITQYIDIDSHKVDVALPFKQVKFKFKDTKTFLANRFGEITNRNWGEVFYDGGETNLDGGLYKIEAPFGHVQYERLNDTTGGVLTDVQWGYNVNNEQSAYLGSPLIFYCYPVDSPTPSYEDISFVDEVNDDNVAISHKFARSPNMPFNSASIDPTINNTQLNFFQEVSEWTRNENGQIFTGDLFSKYYSEYIKSVFNLKQRLTKVSAYLPMSILLNYKLNDRFIINDKQYKINSISTNLKTGKSDLELITDRFVVYNYPPP